MKSRNAYFLTYMLNAIIHCTLCAGMPLLRAISPERSGLLSTTDSLILTASVHYKNRIPRSYTSSSHTPHTSQPALIRLQVTSRATCMGCTQSTGYIDGDNGRDPQSRTAHRRAANGHHMDIAHQQNMQMMQQGSSADDIMHTT